MATANSFFLLALQLVVFFFEHSPAEFAIPVPAGSSFLFSACSWLSSFQLVYYAPAGSTWPPPDYEQLIQLWTICQNRSISTDGFSSSRLAGNNFPAARGGGGGGAQRAAAALSDGFGSGPTGPGPTDEHSFHLHHRDSTVTPIADQIGPIDSVSKTECYDLKNHFSEPHCKMTSVDLLGSRTPKILFLVVTICLQLIVQSLVMKSLRLDFPTTGLDQTMSYQLIQTTSFAMHPRLVEYNAEALVWMYCSFLLLSPLYVLTSSLLLPVLVSAPAAPKLAAPSSHNLTPSASSLAPPPTAASCRDQTCSDQLDGEFPSVLNSSVLLVQADEGVLIPVVDLIDDLPPPTV
ncbi:WPP domain-associated protein [Dorcoceras hygrometricum]|uniref:WPP domain-associated protein n=1 Tax=Dorcoceras hygrometricum TaxID=472368 RepID=A0A2Z7B9M1_9LAMI|nr:WPP domain-associated protein [Dorcoceras hygrometricum]